MCCMLGVKERAFELVGSQMMFCQSVAVLEVIHPLVGLVKTGALAPFMQVRCARDSTLSTVKYYTFKLVCGCFSLV